jgi:hypothetical protein
LILVGFDLYRIKNVVISAIAHAKDIIIRTIQKHFV